MRTSLFKNGADDGMKSEPEKNRNLHIIKNMLLRIKSSEYNILGLKIQMVDVS